MQPLSLFILFTSPHTHTHPRCVFHFIFTKGYFTKSARVALSVIKMNCWCASVQKTNVQSQTALCPSPKERPQSDECAYLRCILTKFSVLTKKCNFTLERCSTRVENITETQRHCWHCFVVRHVIKFTLVERINVIIHHSSSFFHLCNSGLWGAPAYPS